MNDLQQHGGSITYFSYNSAGLLTERATFSASFASATTRPALSQGTAATQGLLTVCRS